MPRVDFWIRKEDYDIWQSIEDKPTFLHEVLQLEKSIKDAGNEKEGK